MPRVGSTPSTASRRALGAASLALALAGCKASPPGVADGGDGLIDGGASFADVVISYAEDGEPVSCSGDLPACGASAACGPTELLGPPDGVTYALASAAVVEVALLCSQILERGGENSPDLRIWASIPAGGAAVVEASYDGSTYGQLDQLAAGDAALVDPELDLDRAQLTVIRFVRIANQGDAAISIDAIGGVTE